MKRRVAATMMAAMLALACAGCGNGETKADGADKDNTVENGKTETAASTEAAAAGEWTPEKDITIIVPYEAGGNTDIPTRIVTQYMQEYTDVTINITNITGAGGRTGVQEAMKADADGYTYVLQASGFPMQSALGIADFTYEDFEEAGYFLDSSLALVVNADSPYETLDDLINAAKENPETVKMGSVTGTIPLFGGLYLQEKNDIAFNMVDLDGSSKAPELLSQRIDTYIDGFGAIKQYIDSGDFRCLAIFADEPIEGYEEIPTLKDLGYDGYGYLNQNFGLWAPKGTDKAAVAYMNNLIKQVSENEDCAAELKEIGYKPTYTTPEEHEEILRQTYEDFANAAAAIIGQ